MNNIFFKNEPNSKIHHPMKLERSTFVNSSISEILDHMPSEEGKDIQIRSEIIPSHIIYHRGAESRWQTVMDCGCYCNISV